MKIGLTYLAMLVSFFALDILWLGFVARDFYQHQLGHWLSANVNWTAATAFYLIFLVGMLVFVVMPTANASWLRVIVMAFLFGIVTYAAYDLTNLATMKDWPVIVAVVDMLWGGVISVIVCCIGHLVIR